MLDRSAPVVFPELHTLWRNGFSRVKNAREAHVGMEAIIVRPKIVGSFPGLDDGVELEGMNGLLASWGSREIPMFRQFSFDHARVVARTEHT
jgi:hypothetical protein